MTGSGTRREGGTRWRWYGTILVSIVAVGCSPPTEPELALRLSLLGRYEHRPMEDYDHLLASAPLSGDRLAVASASGLAVIDGVRLVSGEPVVPLAKFLIDPALPSNLDGAVGEQYAPKLFHLATQDGWIYATTRYDGLWIFSLDGDEPVDRGRRVIERVFTEGVAVDGDRLFLAHHAAGVEVLDLQPDPSDPVSTGWITDPLTDAWGVWIDDGTVAWVADGLGGLKRVSLEGTTVTAVSGDDGATSPGWVFASAPLGDVVLAAVGGRGVAVYDRQSAERLGLYPLSGLCVDVDVIPDGLGVLTCGGWMHVVEVSTDGTLSTVGSTRLHRQPTLRGGSTHIGMSATVVQDTIVVSGWDHLSAFAWQEEGAANVELSTQRIHLADGVVSGEISVRNLGTEALALTALGTSPDLDLAQDAAWVGPGDEGRVFLDRPEAQTPVSRWINLATTDPDEPLLPALALGSQEDRLDPGEVAPGFTLATQSTDGPGEVDLDRLVADGDRVFFPIFGSW